jgi:hypothetical protein
MKVKLICQAEESTLSLETTPKFWKSDLIDFIVDYFGKTVEFSFYRGDTMVDIQWQDSFGQVCFTCYQITKC